MEIFAESQKLMKILADDRKILKEFGKYRMKKIKQRLLELKTAGTLSAVDRVPPTRLHRLSGSRELQFAVDIGANWRITFYGYDENDEQTVDEEEIVAISIIAIEDYH
jgi:hypothetical protein